MTSKGWWRIVSLAVITFCLLIPAAYTLLPTSAIPVATADLQDLPHLEALKTLFNQDQGTPRLVLLLSPT